MNNLSLVVLNQEENEVRKDVLNHIIQNFPEVAHTPCVINTIKNADMKKVSVNELFDFIRYIESIPTESELLEDTLKIFVKKFTNTRKETSDDIILAQEIGDIMSIDKRAKKLFNIIIKICGGIAISDEIEAFLDSYMMPGDADYGILIDYINKLK